MEEREVSTGSGSDRVNLMKERDMKKLAIALMVVCFVLVAVVLVNAQAVAETGRQGETETGSKTASSLPVAPSPSLPVSALLKIRDLQYQQAKRELEKQSLEKRYEQLQKESDTWKAEMSAAIAAGAKAAGVDLQKWDFDSDTLKFIPKPK